MAEVELKASPTSKRATPDEGAESAPAPAGTPFPKRSFLGHALLTFVYPLLQLGYKRPLEPADVWELSADLRCGDLAADLERHWEAVGHQSPKLSPARRLFWAICRLTSRDIIKCMLIGTVEGASEVARPIIIARMLNTFDDDSIVVPLMWALGLFLASLMIAISHGAYLHVSRNHVGLAATSSATALVYKKSLALPGSAPQKDKDGEDQKTKASAEVNLVSTDTEALSEMFYWGLRWWMATIIIVTVIGLVAHELGAVPILASVGFLCFTLSAQAFIGKLQGREGHQAQGAADGRLKVLSEVLGGIRNVKAAGWEPKFADRITALRRVELKHIRRFRGLWAINELISGSVGVLVSVIAIATYTARGGEVTTTKVFTVLAAFNTMRPVIQLLPLAATAVTKGAISMDRIARHLLTPALGYTSQVSPGAWDEHPAGDKVELALEDATLTWDHAVAGRPPTALTPHLHSVSFNIRDAGVEAPLVAVVGITGSGKTSLLNAIMGEMELMSGARKRNASIAYVSQRAWIQQGEFRDNVVFGAPFDAARYAAVVSACGLDQDLRDFPAGDRTELGEFGISLSGGQQQRVALARAAYTRSDCVLLDDPLSALDQTVAARVFDDCVVELMGDRPRVLVTHYLHLLPRCDWVVVVDGGRVVQQGPYAEVKTSPELVTMMELYEASTTAGDAAGEGDEEEVPAVVLRDVEPVVGKAAGDDLVPVSRIVEEETRQVGGVRLALYAQYLKQFGGLPMLALAVVAFLGFNATFALTDWWLTRWSNEGEDADNAFFTRVYILFGISNAVFVLCRAIVFAFGTTRASQHTHEGLLDGILRAPVAFFDANPTGRVLNRFSMDMFDVDHIAPHFLEHMMLCFFMVLMVVVVVIAVVPIFAIVTVVLGVAFVMVARFYIRSLLELKRLMSVSRSPILAFVSASLDGRVTVRAFRKQVDFLRTVQARVDNYVRFNYATYAASWWAQMRLAFVGSSLTGSAALLVVAQRDSVSDSLAGFVLNLSLIASFYLGGLVFLAAELESRFTSVERIMEFTRTPHEAPLVIEDRRPPPNWPTAGAITFKDVAVRYRPDLPQAVSGFTVDIAAGERVSIVGRTGSGKSTLAAALVRLVEPTGSIRIDGVEVTTLGLEFRRHLGVIPQVPFLTGGTLASNVDQFGEHSREEVEAAINSVGLRRAVPDITLDSHVSAGGRNLSVGTRQLVCMARVLLQRSKVLILDEATSGIDLHGDALVQAALRAPAFDGTTIVSISHRLHSVVECDKVIVMDGGRIVEVGAPDELLNAGGEGVEDGKGDASAPPVLRPTASFRALVDSTGPRTARSLRTAAREASTRRLLSP